MKRLLKMHPAVLGILLAILAGMLTIIVSYAVVRLIETRSEAAIVEGLGDQNADWLHVNANGLQIRLTGTAPDEVARFRALSRISGLVDPSRIRDGIEIAPSARMEAPRFSVEMLRNEDGIQLIGLLPAATEGALDAKSLAAAAAKLAPNLSAADMLQTSTWPAPDGWDESLRLGLYALERLPLVKVSVQAGRVEVAAVVANEIEQARFSNDFRDKTPRNVNTILKVTSPRPMISPFILQFAIDDQGARLDACSADTETVRSGILEAATRAGLSGKGGCRIGIGAPSSRWGEAAIAGIRAVAAMKRGSVVISDRDVILTADEDVAQADFDHALSDLRAALPADFSLQANPPPVGADETGPPAFSARLDRNRRVLLGGYLIDEAQEEVVVAYARAAFGAENIESDTGIRADLPAGWPTRVLAGLHSLEQLHEGSLNVRADLIEVEGIAGSTAAEAEITRILAAEVGAEARTRIDVRYDKKLDPEAPPPSPAECLGEINQVMSGRKISFNPGSAEIAADTRDVVEDLAEILRRCPSLPLEIAGYTDSQGRQTTNETLSKARAEAVMMAFLGNGVDTSGMIAVGYGPANPVADNSTAEGREANRRIEFTLIDDRKMITADSEDLADDGGPSLAPTAKTIRPRPRPARK